MEGDPEEFNIRYTQPEDAPHLKEWLQEKEILRWFPMCNDREIDDAVIRWIGFYKFNCSLTAYEESTGIPVGLTTLYLQPYKKIAHQCEFGIIVGKQWRNKGVGKMLLNNLFHIGKTKFNLELIHLQVYEGNPAVNLYKRLGFEEFGMQKRWIKEEDGYVGRIFMEKDL